MSRCVLLDQTCAKLVVFQLHVCNVRSREEPVWVCPLQELQYLGGGSTDCEKTIDSLLDSSGASPASVTRQVESIERAVVMVRLPVTDLPFALGVHRIGRYNGNTHGAIYA